MVRVVVLFLTLQVARTAGTIDTDQVGANKNGNGPVTETAGAIGSLGVGSGPFTAVVGANDIDHGARGRADASTNDILNSAGAKDLTLNNSNYSPAAGGGAVRNTLVLCCPMGYFEQDSACVQCPGGQWNPIDDICPITTCSTCPAGYYCPAGSWNLKICPTGCYCPAGAASYSKCPAVRGAVMAAFGSIPRKHSPHIFSLLNMPHSLYLALLTSSRLVAFPPQGYYCPYAASTYIACAAGKTSEAYATSCYATCAAGQYGSGSCSTCPAGYYCPAGATSASPCPAGYYCPSAGLSSYSTCTAVR